MSNNFGSLDVKSVYYHSRGREEVTNGVRTVLISYKMCLDTQFNMLAIWRWEAINLETARQAVTLLRDSNVSKFLFAVENDCPVVMLYYFLELGCKVDKDAVLQGLQYGRPVTLRGLVLKLG